MMAVIFLIAVTLEFWLSLVVDVTLAQCVLDGTAIEKVRIGDFGGVLAYLISKTVSRTLIAS